jgi:small-conductance mechanosensitive channel
MVAPQDISNVAVPFANGIALNPFIEHITIAIVSLLVGFILGKIIGRLVTISLKAIHFDNALERMSLRINAEKSIGNLVSIAIYAIAIIFALEQLAVAQYVINALIALLIVIAVISGFLALKDILPNLVGSMIIASQRRIRPGRIMTIKGVQGTIQETRALSVTILTENNDLLVVPAAAFLTSPYTIKKTSEHSKTRASSSRSKAENARKAASSRSAKDHPAPREP